MIRRIAYFLIPLAIAIVLWIANLTYGNYYLERGAIMFFAVSIVYLFFKIALQDLVTRKVSDPRNQYSLHRAVSIMFYAAMVLAVIGTWIPNIRTLAVTYGIVAAGIAVALQDIFKSFAGGVLLFISGVYRVGDRIEIDNKYGDVIDIGLMYTTILEIREWVEGDQPTGRIDILPNSLVLNHTVRNYTKQLNFIFEELNVPISYESDWRKARDRILEIVRKETGPVADAAEGQMRSLGEKYFLEKRAVEPSVFLTLTDNWINLGVRYPTWARERRTMMNRISRAILEMVESEPDIDIASATIDIVGFPKPDAERAKVSGPPDR
ncbi:MAG: mechanosensitive channel MscS [Methanocella sp. PtaU1.Bin125]|nr:MAG: mechanosensitive channel MscS [Methanocella sp. PtaU1.Bin125]